MVSGSFFWQAEDGIRYLVRSRGLGDVYKRQGMINRSETRELESLRPRLIQEAKGFLEEADRAYRLSLIHI